MIGRINEILSDLGLVPPGWEIDELRDIASDGRTIVGDGLNPDGGRVARGVRLNEDLDEGGRQKMPAGTDAVS